ncbi:hypothetical protein Enr17x_15040 [Gimesia fumaroli]|uniref:Uncharacterized protein n=1 Tax=Gimesia fumaroli TaxID=2527976 RepID=A0A518I8Q3_9PLAN|nr:hypothetical protein Enr17x_15040 [Gimesia fumaroli]
MLPPASALKESISILNAVAASNVTPVARLKLSPASNEISPLVLVMSALTLMSCPAVPESVADNQAMIPAETASFTVSAPVVVKKMVLEFAVIPLKPSTVPITRSPVLSIANPPPVALTARVLTSVSRPVIPPPAPPARRATRSAVIRAFPFRSLMPPPVAVTRTSLVVVTFTDSTLKNAVKSISLAPASIEPAAPNVMS